MLEKSCGTVPYTIEDGVIKYLLIRTRSGRSCGFPKGHVETGETECETALRETFEETSVKVEIEDGFRYETSYRLENGNYKTVIYFLASFRDQKPRRNADFEDYVYLLLPYNEALKALSFKSAKEMLTEANELLLKKGQKSTV